MDSKADTKIKDGTGITPLLLAVVNDQLLACKKLVFPKTITKLHFHETDSVQDSLNVLHLTALHGCPKVMEWLLATRPGLISNPAHSQGLAIHFAARGGSVECLKLLIGAGSEINAADCYSMTPLHLAALSGNVECTIELLLNNAQLHESFVKERIEAIHLSCTRDSDKLVNALVQARLGNINTCDANGMNALHYAAKHGCVKPLDWILGSTSVPVDTLNPYNSRTALHYACGSRMYETAYSLIMRGANVNACDASYYTPLHLSSDVISSTSASFATEIIDLLLKQGANVNMADKNGNTPIHYLAVTKGWALNAFSQLQTALLSKGGVANVKNVRGRTPLHMMLQPEFEWVYEPSIHLLLQVAPEMLDSRDVYGRTPLHYAAVAPHVLYGPQYNTGCAYYVLRLLINMGADCRVQDSAGKTPLHLFMETYCDHIDATAVLEMVQAFPDLLLIPDQYQITPIKLALKLKNLLESDSDFLKGIEPYMSQLRFGPESVRYMAQSN